MRSNTQRMLRLITIVTTLGSLATVAVNLYSSIKQTKRNREIDHKLDDRLVDSMDCSDATATY